MDDQEFIAMNVIAYNTAMAKWQNAVLYDPEVLPMDITDRIVPEMVATLLKAGRDVSEIGKIIVQFSVTVDPTASYDETMAEWHRQLALALTNPSTHKP